MVTQVLTLELQSAFPYILFNGKDNTTFMLQCGMIDENTVQPCQRIPRIQISHEKHILCESNLFRMCEVFNQIFEKNGE